MLCAQAVCSKGVLLFLCVPVAVWGLVVGAVGCRVCRCAPPPPPSICAWQGWTARCVAGMAWGIAGCQGDIVSLDVWAYLVSGTHF